MIKITIGGEDFTTYIVNIPFIDESCPEWGNVEGVINDTLDIKVPIRFLPFFSAESEIEVVYTSNDIILFKGFIAQVKHDNKYVELLCKSETYVLFNRHIRENEIISIYYAKNKYPSDIMKEILELSGLTMNLENYYTITDFYRNLGVTFSVTNENWVTSELLNKLAEVTLSRIYYYNGEFYMEPVFLWDDPPFVEINEKQWVDYPVVEKWEKYEADYKGTEVKFGEYISYSIRNERIPEKTVDISFNSTNGIYTDSITTAQHVADIYDFYYSQPMYRLNGSLKPIAMTNINKGSFLYWDNRIYAIINIKNSSYTKKEIECIGIESYLEIIKSYKDVGGSLILDMQHNSLDSLQPSGMADYYHLSQPQWNALTQANDADSLHWHTHNNLHDLDTGDYLHLTNTQKSALTGGSSTNADSMHTHDLSNFTGDLDDIADGTNYKRIASPQSASEINLTGNQLSLSFGPPLYGIGGKNILYENDLDDVTETGFYYCNAFASNKPTSSNGFLIHHHHVSSYSFQMFKVVNGQGLFIRYQGGSGWGTWAEIPTSVDGESVVMTNGELSSKHPTYISTLTCNASTSPAVCAWLPSGDTIGGSNFVSSSARITDNSVSFTTSVDMTDYLIEVIPVSPAGFTNIIGSPGGVHQTHNTSMIDLRGVGSYSIRQTSTTTAEVMLWGDYDTSSSTRAIDFSVRDDDCDGNKLILKFTKI